MRGSEKTSPTDQFQRSATYVLRYELLSAVAASAFLVAFAALRLRPLSAHWEPWFLLLLPPACYLQVLGQAYLHNATHGNFPRSVNRLVGELCGVLVLSRFATMEILHRRHYAFHDDPAKDPNPVTAKTFGAFLLAVPGNADVQLRTMCFELHGDAAAVRRVEAMRQFFTRAAFVLLTACWWMLLGSPLFFAVFLPAWFLGLLQLVHLSWAGHGGNPPSGRAPLNLDHGLYRVGNALLHGIYMHANHHRDGRVFDPRNVHGAS